METPRVWLITGASSGFGKSLTEFVLSKGDIAVATLRKPEVLHDLSAGFSKDQLLVLKVDVTNQADIDHAFARTKEVFGRLDVVFNNAGYSIFGEAEMTPVDIARAMFEVNFWGAVNVSRAAIRFFREVNEPGRGGVLLQNSSIEGIECVPGLAFYSATKHGKRPFDLEVGDLRQGTINVALNGFSEGLAREVLPQWNIKICVIQAGGFSTNIVSNNTFLPESPIYHDKISKVAAVRNILTAPGFQLMGEPAKFVKAIYTLVEGGNLPLHFPIGQDALAKAKTKVESLEKEISEAEPWSADLLRDDISLPTRA